MLRTFVIQCRVLGNLRSLPAYEGERIADYAINSSDRLHAQMGESIQMVLLTSKSVSECKCSRHSQNRSREASLTIQTSEYVETI